MENITIGTPLSPSATRVMILGAGELGKELVIELQRLSLEVIAVDSYPNAPAMQVAHRSHIIDMLNSEQLLSIVAKESPGIIIPEIEAISTDALSDAEKTGIQVVPTAKAIGITMNREKIRRFAAEQLKLKTSPYRFAESKSDCISAINDLGCPCVVKPIMSSSGKGQSFVYEGDDPAKAWDTALLESRTGEDKVIVEKKIDFEYEITLLTVRHTGGISFCAPIGHLQRDGDYCRSWQPHPMSPAILEKCKSMATAITEGLGGFGIYGAEFFVKKNEVFFNEISPRPHDTGMVTMISQNISQFALHIRAVLGFSIPAIEQRGSAASVAIAATGTSKEISFGNLKNALSGPNTELRLFGKQLVGKRRRLGVALALDKDIDSAVNKARLAAEAVAIKL